MTHPVCSFLSQRLGVPPNVIQCMITAIQRMTHTVRTGYGDADVSYGNYDDKSLQGGGQGNGAALPLYVAISCILISVLESAVKDVYFYTAMTLQIVQFIAIMYVDDTDLLLSVLSDTETIEDVIKRAQKAATVWQKAVLDSGGAVRPDKCYWSAVDFEWSAGKWRYKKIHEIKGKIRIRKPAGKKETIKRYDLDKANEGLGVYITPRGSLQLQLKETSDKIRVWTEKWSRAPSHKKKLMLRLHPQFSKQSCSYYHLVHSTENSARLLRYSYTKIYCQKWVSAAKCPYHIASHLTNFKE